MTTQQKLAATKKKKILREKVGKSFKKWRLSQGFVLTQVAAEIDTSQGSLSDLENGKCLASFQTIYNLKKKYSDTDWDKVLFA